MQALISRRSAGGRERQNTEGRAAAEMGVDSLK